MLEDAILDNPSVIMDVDKKNMLQFIERTAEFLRDATARAEALQIPVKTKVLGRTITYQRPKNVIVVGMGGSAISGDLLKGWLFDKASVPVETCRDFILPAYADHESLVVAVSYSGDTEETLSAFLQAVERGCIPISLSSGGYLQKISQRLKTPHIQIPADFPTPRSAIAYLFMPLVVLMKKLRIVTEVEPEITETFRIAERVSQENGVATSSTTNKAKKIALEICNTVPVVYGFRQYSSVARRLKCQFNENSKVPSRFDSFTELDHNEVVGWEAPTSLTKNFSIIIIRDREEPPQITQRIELTKQIVSPRVHKVIEIESVGQRRLAKMLSTIQIGDFASAYLALLKGTDPTPTEAIAHIKANIGKNAKTMKTLSKLASLNDSSR
ncbi:bifunctional phosphoglucose/phosphomannose isomerase [Candidatus Bathyarchaeota archaeon]|nr:bifunctional phosphoglucose/phosphomannose isomerase [Candidatus Bathyarchaeota archaeon]